MTERYDYNREETEWLRKRHYELIDALHTLLLAVPSQGKNDAMDEMVAKVRYLVEKTK